MGTQDDLVDRLRGILNDLGLSDERLLSGVRLTDSGHAKVARKLGVEASEVELLLRATATRIRNENASMAELSEADDDQPRYSYETDLMKNVMVRDSETGKTAFVRGSEASALLNRMANADQNEQQTILASYGSKMMEAGQFGDRAMVASDEDHEREAVHHDTLKKTGFYGAQGAGCVILARATGRILIAHRSGAVEQPNTWGGWGGAIDSGEDPKEATVREVYEEAGYTGQIEQVLPLYVFKKDTFRYSNFLVIVPDEFEPDLNWESQGSRWVEAGQWPSPLHFGLKALFADPKSAETIKTEVAKSRTRGLDEGVNAGPIDLEESFHDEIHQTGGSYNFPWKVGSRKGTATARYKGRGPEMTITVVSVRDAEGETIEGNVRLDKAIHDQAIAFIGQE